ncbi:alcohol dehydrogenase catalytic domain-containing protein [Nocardiopsis metallicus]|uniref:Threonine dehydrogenase-like Zn-dependent dehydrogenase n=1 Tax=Nocardiopsis metallicus TaxID=179819 RepID=A0A840WVV3_9ACTN|nr:alcohol dehydrogenase catalytic domain-containing protein [Nocardiopsis metallicus]MBB5494278.1 threonine dehydrogenase-like Zn-dependent dehydrogenase [Nocardiopsis metallicus]
MDAEPRDGADLARIATFHEGEVAVERVELSPRKAGEIDLTMLAAAVCGSDLHTVLGHRPAPPRTALGHEGVGVVHDIDPDAKDLRGTPLLPGDRVVFALFDACGTCDRCADGLAMKCRSVLKYGHESVDREPRATGTLADRVRLLPGVPVLRVPDGPEDTLVVSAGCAVATAAEIVSAAGPEVAGRAVLVVGAGAVGAYCVAMFAAMGCRVGVREPSAERLTLAESLGGGPDAEGPYPVVVEASGHPDAFVGALDAVDVGGRLIAAGSVSPGATAVTLDPALLVTRRISVIGVHNYTLESFVRGVDWLLEHGDGLDLDRLLSPPVPLAEIADGFALMRGGGFARVLVRP